MSSLTTTVSFEVPDAGALAEQLAARYRCLSGGFINDCAQKVCPSGKSIFAPIRSPAPDVSWALRATNSAETRLFAEQMIRNWQAKNLTDANIRYVPSQSTITFR